MDILCNQDLLFNQTWTGKYYVLVRVYFVDWVFPLIYHKDICCEFLLVSYMADQNKNCGSRLALQILGKNQFLMLPCDQEF